jgi:hypothetical protein
MSFPVHYCPDCDCWPCGCREEYPAEDTTLGGGHAQIYVTRAAALEYQAFHRALGLDVLPFEQARRELTHLLLPAEPVPGDARRYTFHAGMPIPNPRKRPVLYTLVAYVVPDGELLVVGGISLAEDAPGAYTPIPPAKDGGGVMGALNREARCRNAVVNAVLQEVGEPLADE